MKKAFFSIAFKNVSSRDNGKKKFLPVTANLSASNSPKKSFLPETSESLQKLTKNRKKLNDC